MYPSAHTSKLVPRFAYLYATLCFFAGVFVTFVLDRVLHYIEHCLVSRKAAKNLSTSTSPNPFPTSSPKRADDKSVAVPPARANDVERQITFHHDSSDTDVNPQPPTASEPIAIDDHVGHDGHLVASIYESNHENTRALIRMGIFAGIALAFHVRVWILLAYSFISIVC